MAQDALLRPGYYAVDGELVGGDEPQAIARNSCDWRVINPRCYVTLRDGRSGWVRADELVPPPLPACVTDCLRRCISVRLRQRPRQTASAGKWVERGASKPDHGGQGHHGGTGAATPDLFTDGTSCRYQGEAQCIRHCGYD